MKPLFSRRSVPPFCIAGRRSSDNNNVIEEAHCSQSSRPPCLFSTFRQIQKYLLRSSYPEKVVCVWMFQALLVTAEAAGRNPSTPEIYYVCIPFPNALRLRACFKACLAKAQNPNLLCSTLHIAQLHTVRNMAFRAITGQGSILHD